MAVSTRLGKVREKQNRCVCGCGRGGGGGRGWRDEMWIQSGDKLSDGGNLEKPVATGLLARLGDLVRCKVLCNHDNQRKKQTLKSLFRVLVCMRRRRLFGWHGRELATCEHVTPKAAAQVTIRCLLRSDWGQNVNSVPGNMTGFVVPGGA